MPSKGRPPPHCTLFLHKSKRTSSRDVSDAVHSLWCDPAVQEPVHRSRNFKLNDSAVNYSSAIDHHTSLPSYLPTSPDILRSREKTTGITETTCTVGELIVWCRSSGFVVSRMSWHLCFLASLSEYHQMLYEDESVVCFIPRIFLSVSLIRIICKKLLLSCARYAIYDGLLRDQRCIRHLFLYLLDAHFIYLFAEKLPLTIRGRLDSLCFRLCLVAPIFCSPL